MKNPRTKVCSGQLKQIQYTQCNQTSFTYSKLNANTEYTFRVAATNAIGRSGKRFGFSKKSPFLERVIIYNVDMKHSSDS